MTLFTQAMVVCQEEHVWGAAADRSTQRSAQGWDHRDPVLCARIHGGLYVHAGPLLPAQGSHARYPLHRGMRGAGSDVETTERWPPEASIAR